MGRAHILWTCLLLVWGCEDDANTGGTAPNTPLTSDCRNDGIGCNLPFVCLPDAHDLYACRLTELPPDDGAPGRARGGGGMTTGGIGSEAGGGPATEAGGTATQAGGTATQAGGTATQAGGTATQAGGTAAEAGGVDSGAGGAGQSAPSGGEQRGGEQPGGMLSGGSEDAGGGQVAHAGEGGHGDQVNAGGISAPTHGACAEGDVRLRNDFIHSCTNTCQSTQNIACGEQISNQRNDGDTDHISYWDCGLTSDYEAPERTYRFVVPSDITEFRQYVHGNLTGFLVEDRGQGCRMEDCINRGSGDWVPAVAGTTYYIVVDGFDGRVAQYRLEMECR